MRIGLIVVGFVAYGASLAADPCDPNYDWVCVPMASDVDCRPGQGNGPAYIKGPLRVIGLDVYHLDGDHNGFGCEPKGWTPPIGAVSARVNAASRAGDCHPNYAEGCVPISTDVDCRGGGNGPDYIDQRVKVIGVDTYGLDADHDGYGCGSDPERVATH
ncbi:hypothetical protein [Antarctobacter sp.]|uniref:hypothetical protein n=1 Tax=Antarctobacter sp. TaxID=1872577 RepID=UPI003A957721